MEFHAIDSTTAKVVLIKNNQIIANMQIATRSGDCVGLRADCDKACELLKDHPTVLSAVGTAFEDRKFRWAFVHFSARTGQYLGDDDGFYEPLRDVRAVDLFELMWGTVSFELFGQVPEYGMKVWPELGFTREQYLENKTNQARQS